MFYDDIETRAPKTMIHRQEDRITDFLFQISKIRLIQCCDDQRFRRARLGLGVKKLSVVHIDKDAPLCSMMTLKLGLQKL